jgi:hypothetical protein
VVLNLFPLIYKSTCAFVPYDKSTRENLKQKKKKKRKKKEKKRKEKEKEKQSFFGQTKF